MICCSPIVTSVATLLWRKPENLPWKKPRKWSKTHDIQNVKETWKWNLKYTLPALPHKKIKYCAIFASSFLQLKAILNRLTIYKQAIFKSSACSKINSLLNLFQETFDVLFYLHLNRWYSPWAKSPSRGRDFMRYGGDFVIYQIWGKILDSRGTISAD